MRVPVDEEGIQVEIGIKLSKHARAAFVTPSHQYPLGMPMSLARRTALLAWAKQQMHGSLKMTMTVNFVITVSPFHLYKVWHPTKSFILELSAKSYFHRLGLAMPYCLKNWWHLLWAKSIN